MSSSKRFETGYRMGGLATAALALLLGGVFAACDDDGPATVGGTGGTTTAGTGGTGGAQGSTDIVATAQAAGTFKTLAAALQAADLVATLKGPGPFTVFAPTDAAFGKLPAGTVDNLLKPENKTMLQAILKYHVVAGRVPASEVVKLTSAKTLEGRSVTIAVTGSTVRVNDATVTTADVDGGNGIIHVIDTVLLPPAM